MNYQSSRIGEDIDPRYGSSFMAKKNAVATPNKLASMAANRVLNKGGNAIDAMVTANSVLGVVFPHMTGAGGDSFWLIYDAKTGKRYSLNATGHSGEDVSLDKYDREEGMPIRGAKAVSTVPGAVSGWIAAHERFGKLSMKECLEPAIDYARNGFPVSRSLAKFSEVALTLLRTYPSTAKVFLKQGVAPYMKGDTMKNPDLADTLEKIAEKGTDAFYKGEIADKVTDFLQKHGGLLKKQDFERHEATWQDPIEVQYGDRTVIAPPPNSAGMVTLQILGMMDHLDITSMKGHEEQFIDAFTRATAFSFMDRDEFLDDPDFNKIPTDVLLSKEYFAERVKKMHDPSLGPPENGYANKGDTTFSCAVDDEGNAVGVIQSLYWEWGSGVVAEGTGMMLQNRGTYFSLDPKARNKVEPNKRPAHTLTCSMVFDTEDKPEIIVGAMGGDGEPQTQAIIIMRLLDQGYSVQEAIDSPRWLLGRTWGDDIRGLRLEGRYDKKLAKQLEDLGHVNVTIIENFSDLMGHAQAIRIWPDRIEAGADPRAGGLAIGN